MAISNNNSSSTVPPRAGDGQIPKKVQIWYDADMDGFGIANHGGTR